MEVDATRDIHIKQMHLAVLGQQAALRSPAVLKMRPSLLHSGIDPPSR